MVLGFPYSPLRLIRPESRLPATDPACTVLSRWMYADHCIQTPGFCKRPRVLESCYSQLTDTFVSITACYTKLNGRAQVHWEGPQSRGYLTLGDSSEFRLDNQ